MAIPALTAEGWLPPGVHMCTLPEVGAAFTAGGNPSRRGRLVGVLGEHLDSATVRRYVEHVIIDGSFVSTKVEPGDVDIVLGVRSGMFKALAHGSSGVNPMAVIEGLEGRFGPFIDGRRVIHGFADETGGHKYRYYLNFFQQSTRANESPFKGVLRVDLR